MRVFLTGGTGFTGRRVAASLAKAGHEVTCLVRPSSDRRALDGVPVGFVAGDLADSAGLETALRGQDALVNAASIGFGHGPGIVRAATGAGVRRAVFFSTTAVFTTLPAPSRAVRLAAEEAIRNSDLDWTILRPTMIYGAPGDRNVERLLGALRRWPVLPVIGRGNRLVQPVTVDDLAAAVPRVLAAAGTVRRAYSLPGRAPVAFREFVRAAGRAVGRCPVLVPIPARGAVAAARLHEGAASRPRIRAEQVLRLLEDKDFDWSAAGRDFGYDPAPVETGLEREAKRLGLGARA